MLDTTLSQLNDFITKRMGLRFPQKRWADLERGITSAAHDFGFSDIDSCIEWLLSSKPSKSQIEILASYLTVGETYFFREEKVFSALEDRILKDLIQQRRKTDRYLRIWSAGCATGEEPYSIAILLDKMLPDLQDWNITILATDINPDFLKKAITGIYGNWSFRECPKWVTEKYFKKTANNRYEILSNIKKMVVFQYHNLCDDIYPSLLNNTNSMDIILCRNVLMYFSQDKIEEVVQKYHNCLIDDGWMIVSPCEVSMISQSQLLPVRTDPYITLYRKGDKSSYTKTTPSITDSIFCPQTETVWPEDMDFPQIDNKIIIPDKQLPETKDEFPSKKQYKFSDASDLYKKGDYTGAEHILTELLTKNPEETEIMVMLSRTYANRGKLQEAMEWCEKAISKDKLNPGYHYLLATIMQEKGQFPEATTSLKHAIFLNPNLVPAYFSLGMLSYRHGKLKESNKYFENALSLLKDYRQEDVLPETDLTVGRLTEIIHSTVYSGGLNEAK